MRIGLYLGPLTYTSVVISRRSSSRLHTAVINSAEGTGGVVTCIRYYDNRHCARHVHVGEFGMRVGYSYSILHTACFFGEGAIAEGEFHESMNLAALWKLPVLFCCENNLYAMGTALKRSESETDLCLKAAAFEMPGWPVDGMDVLAVEEATKRAAIAVRSGGGPHFLEFRTYRFRAHSMYDPELYREKQEVEEWKKRDPIQILIERMKAADAWREEQWEKIEAEVGREVAQSVEFAEAGVWEPVEELTRFVYSEIAPAESDEREFSRKGAKTQS